MQLFHKEYIIEKNILIIKDPETVTQCRKVLRLQKGDLLHVQDTKANTTTRHLIKIQELGTTLSGEIIESNEMTRQKKHTQMIVAMPNKQDKIELITQKLTEIGVDEIIFRPAERSVIKQWNKNKEIRLKTIIKEATEQSRGRFMSEFSFRKHPEDVIRDNALVYIFDKNDNTKENETNQNITGIIGPEGGLTPKDYARFEKHNAKVYGLGESILRMETAAIIGGRLLKNQ